MRLSLRRKLAGGFGLLLLLIALLGWVTLSLFGSLRTVQRRVFDEAVPGLIVVDEIVRAYTAQSAAIRGFLIVNQERLLDQYRAEVDQAERWQRAAQRVFRGNEEMDVLAQLIRAGARYQSLIEREVIPLAEQGRRALAFDVLGQRGSSLIQEIDLLAGRLRAAQDEIVAQSENELRVRSNQALATLILVILVALLVGSGVAVALPRRLVANLSRLVEAARAIGRGDFDQQVEIRSGDEVEELASRFGEMQAGLKRLQQLALHDRELEIAASIQKNLLQRSVPESEEVRVVPTHRQANLVGGDWFDVDLWGRTLTVVIADASGKGIGAALMATVALSVLRAERGLGATPARVVGRSNEVLREATDPDSFTTLVYLTLDLDSGEARWLNMGHHAPFLLPAGSREGGFVEGPRNRALGWYDEPGLAETSLRLEPGDRLVLYTDGFLDAKSDAGEVFGEERFGASLRELASLDAADIGETLVAEVSRHAAGNLGDDLTIIVVEFQGAPLVRNAPERLTGEEPWHSRR